MFHIAHKYASFLLSIKVSITCEWTILLVSVIDDVLQQSRCCIAKRLTGLHCHTQHTVRRLDTETFRGMTSKSLIYYGFWSSLA